MSKTPAGVGDADVVVVGAGVIGSAIAYELARRGRRTLSLDALPAAGFGSTSNSSAIVRFTYSTLAGVSMAWEGMHFWRDWADYLGVQDERGPAELVTCGMALLDTPTGHAKKVRPLFDQLAIPYEHWDAAETERRIPFLDARVMGPPVPIDSEEFWTEPTTALDGALWSPDSGYVSDPQLAAHNLQRAAEAHGARFVFHTVVTSIEQSGDVVTGVTLADGTSVRAPVVINVAGPDSGRVNALAGIGGRMRIGVRPMRQEVHHLPSPRDRDGQPLRCMVTDDDTGIYFKPEAGDMIAVGSLEPACDELEWLDTADQARPTVTLEGWERQTTRLARRVPELRVPNRPLGIVGVYDVADDWIPIYDRTDLGGYYVAIGSSGNQFKNAPVAAHCMAELVTAVEDGHDHDADPLTVKGPYTGTSIDLATFARNRVVNPASSFSVNG